MSIKSKSRNATGHRFIFLSRDVVEAHATVAKHVCEVYWAVLVQWQRGLIVGHFNNEGLHQVQIILLTYIHKSALTTPIYRLPQIYTRYKWNGALQ